MSLTPDQNSAITPPSPPADLNRRTILQGAAWTIPAIAVATVAPAASASTNAVLAFNQASYSGTACSSITGAYVTVTTGGAPTAGVSVTITLGGGYTFAGGSATYTQVSGSDGRVNLPSVGVPAVGGLATATAISATSTASAVFESSPSTSVWTARDSNGNITTFANVPASATPTDGYGYFVDGTNLWYSNSIVDTNVTKAVGGSVAGVNRVQYLKGTTWTARDSNGGVTTFGSIPASATPTSGFGYFVDGTNLWYSNSIVDTNVTKAVGGSVAGVNWVQYLKGNTWTIRDSNGRNDSVVLSGTPLAATPTNSLGYFISGTDLYHNGSILDTNVTKVVGGSVNGVDWVQYLKSTAC